MPTAETMAEVTNSKSLPRQRRNTLQVQHVPHLSKRAKLVKLADKICNLRDVATSPPKDWSLQSQREYFDWAKQVVDGLRGLHPRLESLFDAARGAALEIFVLRPES